MERAGVADVRVGTVSERTVDLVFWGAVLVAGSQRVHSAGVTARRRTCGVDGLAGVELDAGGVAHRGILRRVGVAQL